MPHLFHVSSVLNRTSIETNGLDWTLMGAARGIAGSGSPEVEGVFLCPAELVGFFERINNTGGPVDVWAVDGIAEADLVGTGTGFEYFPGRVPAARLTLVRTTAEPTEHEARSDGGSRTAYQGELTLTFDDCSEQSGDEVRAFIERSSD